MTHYQPMNDSAKPIDEICPCCGQQSLESFEQPTIEWKGTLFQGYTMTHCLNDGTYGTSRCPMYGMTAKHERFMANAAAAKVVQK